MELASSEYAAHTAYDELLNRDLLPRPSAQFARLSEFAGRGRIGGAALAASQLFRGLPFHLLMCGKKVWCSVFHAGYFN
ncbi:MAG: hypothetical protein PHP70_11230 [Gallionella sp.]|nr:hypothetical protein [Gallionella sp.]